MMTLSDFLTIATFVGSLIAGGWVLLSIAGRQFDRRLTEKFAAQEQSRTEDRARWEERMAKMEVKQDKLDGELRGLLIDLPKEYVARGDYVRRETVIEAKIDRIGLQMENYLLRVKAAHD